MLLLFLRIIRRVTGRKESLRNTPHITSTYFHDKGEDVEIIKIEGSVEIAPLLGLADAIVDIVETGKTLQENGLIVFEEMYFISARMIVNKAALKTKKRRNIQHYKYDGARNLIREIGGFKMEIIYEEFKEALSKNKSAERKRQYNRRNCSKKCKRNH